MTPPKTYSPDELEQLEADKRRLDWLADKDNHIGSVLLPKECVLDNLTSLRGAIDDAMKMAKEEIKIED